jgi:hypothetical protein
MRRLWGSSSPCCLSLEWREDPFKLCCISCLQPLPTGDVAGLMPEGVIKHGKSKGVALLHDAVAHGWVTPADAAQADAMMALRYRLISAHNGYVNVCFVCAVFDVCVEDLRAVTFVPTLFLVYPAATSSTFSIKRRL